MTAVTERVVHKLHRDELEVAMLLHPTYVKHSKKRVERVARCNSQGNIDAYPSSRAPERVRSDAYELFINL